MISSTRVQVLDEAICVSFRTNALVKYMNQFFSSLTAQSPAAVEYTDSISAEG